LKPIPDFRHLVLAALFALPAPPADGAEPPATAGRPSHQQSARLHGDARPPPIETPPLPEGMSLDEVLDYAATPPPAGFPDSVPDDRIYAFVLVEQFEARFPTGAGSDHLGWEAQGWIGGDFHKFWWKNEGEATFDGFDRGESETDLLYSRLITPFWNFQAGVQYANEWNRGEYDDRWSATLALQGLAPYKFELDNSLYLSEDGHLTAAIEAEYDVRITQRLVLQPRTEVGLSAQDVPERGLGAGLTDVTLDLRLRYEIKREFAPYLGLRYRFLVGETDAIAESAGEDTEEFLLLAGLRFAF